MYKADKRLKNIYDKYNKAYWDGQLPANIEIGWNDDMKPGSYGLTQVMDDPDETRHTTFQIHIDTIIKGIHDITHMTVLHEMCHVRLYPYMQHGKRFQEEMIRLAVRGAFEKIW